MGPQPAQKIPPLSRMLFEFFEMISREMQEDLCSYSIAPETLNHQTDLPWRELPSYSADTRQ